MAVQHSPIRIDGTLDEWIEDDRIDGAAPVSGYRVYGTSDTSTYSIALTSPTAIGANTTIWLNTDRNASTGYQVFGFAGGAEYNINFAADGTASLYTGAAGQTLVAGNLLMARSADGKTMEVQIPKALIGNPPAINILTDVNDAAYIPGNYSGPQYTIFGDTGIVPDAGKRVAIVYSETTAKNYFSETAYAQLFMAAQSQVMQAGVPFDILTEKDLTSLQTLAKYDTIVFPSFRNVQVGSVDAITATLEQATRQFGIGLVAAGEFMTNGADNAALAGDSYGRMKLLFDATRITGGFPADVTLKSADANHLVLDNYVAGETIRQYTGVGWTAIGSVSGTGTTIVTETVNGQNYTAALATQTAGGGRNVLFSSEAVMADSNLLWQAVDHSVNGAGVSVGLEMTRNSSIVASRTDMDQSQYRDEVNPANNAPGIYDKLLPILESWKKDFNFVGSYYVNVGNNAAADETTDWTVSGAYYKQLLAMGNELGSHSYTHPENTNLLTPAEVAFQFGEARKVLEQEMSKVLGYAFTVGGAAVPGAPETLGTSQEIMKYVDYLSGGYAGVGAGYPNAFGYIQPGTDKVYLAPNTSFDFSLVEFQGKTPAQAEAAWAAEWAALTAKAETPVVIWPWHDYGPTAWTADATGAPSKYTQSMFTNWIERAYTSGAEFVTLLDLAQRVSAMSHATLTTSIVGDVITAKVGASNIGTFALDVDGQGSKVIKSVAGWYAYDEDSVFMPASGGTFTITLGAVADDVTHITALPMRASLISVKGDGRNLAFTAVGEGSVTIDLAATGTDWVKTTGATVVSRTGDILTLALGAIGSHDVAVGYVANVAPVLTSGAGKASIALTILENSAAVATIAATDANAALGDVVKYTLAAGGDAALFTVDEKTGVLKFIAAPDFETPLDAGRDNVYNVTVLASDARGASTAQAYAVTIGDVAGVNLRGGLFNDTLTGSGENDTIDGSWGNDILYGRGGNDTLIGGLGDDSLYGEDGNDNLTGDSGRDMLDGGAGNDTLNGGSGEDKLYGRAGNDTLIGDTYDDYLDGGDGDDFLDGGANEDILIGGAGNDILDGGSSEDILTGGAGRDIFRFSKASDTGTSRASRDVITDFIRGEDRIDLSLIDANTRVAGDQAFTLLSGTNAKFTAPGQLRVVYQVIDGVEHTILEGNTDTGSLAEFSVDLVGHFTFTPSDFML
ncbi:M10 family metallopeptidase C-terminal domain-containing protein [Sphingomonas mollis]|uniref:Cadherin domain-containing protein n=1 Tax=Sphingomonas mollis TaxID=2795726 RepID=A0ABS0XT61_9SPHN|nr:cadherin domain-containing protein [Sphingomonas sp. BT553]MBJ6123250.1 cadherin domain-containing protein [Sphingomonas sp. BT553]